MFIIVVLTFMSLMLDISVSTISINTQIHIPILVVLLTVIIKYYQFLKLAMSINMRTATGSR